MALVRNHLERGAPCPRRGHVGWTYKQKAYFTGGYTEIIENNPAAPFPGRKSQLLRDIHCLDLQTVSWLSECPFPVPTAYLDGHTASWIGTKLILIAGGTYPEGHNPNHPFSLMCSSYVYILETNPPCNPDGSIPALEWRRLQLVQPILNDFDLHGDDMEIAADDAEIDEDGDAEWDDEEDADQLWGAPEGQLAVPLEAEDDIDAELEEILAEMQAAAPPRPAAVPAALPRHPGPHVAEANQLAAAPQGRANGIREAFAQALHAGRNLLGILPRLGLGGAQRADEAEAGANDMLLDEPPIPRLPVPETAMNDGEPIYLRPRVWHSATVVGNRIYIIGGRDMHLRYFGDVTYFDTEKEVFVRVKLAPKSPKLPPRAAHGAVCPDDRHIYVFGGRYKYPTVAANGLTHRHYNDLWVFDTRYNSWKLLIDPPEADPSKYMKQPIHPNYRAAMDEPQEEAVAETNLNHSMDSQMLLDDPEGEQLSIKRASSKDPDDYPAPRCCFVMVLDPDLPHLAHLVGGYTSSNVCFYYIGDAWTLDLLELSWKPMKFLQRSDPLNRISIHTPTYFYDELLLFAGEGSVDVAEVPYGSQQFLPFMTIFTIPQNKFSDVLRYRDPVAYNYYQLSLRSDLADVTLEIGGSTFNLHRVVVAARMKRFHQLLLESGEWSTAASSLSLSSSLSSSRGSSLRSSAQRASSTSQICTIKCELWDGFIRASLPSDFFETFHQRTFEPEVISQAILFAYTDAIHKIHRLSFDRLVQLYHFGMITDLKRLSAVALLQISERLDPHFPSSEVGLIAELLVVTWHYFSDISEDPTTLKLINALIWHYSNSVTAGTSHGFRQRHDQAESSSGVPSSSPAGGTSIPLPSNSKAESSHANLLRLTPTMTLPKPPDYSSVCSSRDVDQVANEWLKHSSGAFAPLSVAMEALFIALNESEITRTVEGDFELYVPSPASQNAMDEGVESSVAGSSVSASPADAGEQKSMSLPFPPLPPPTTPIVVHKNILTFSSLYLKGLLSNSFQETQQGFASVGDLPYPMEQASLSALIRFMYGGSVQHIQDKNTALDILCNVPFFYSQRQELLKPLPHLGQRSTRLLRPRSLEIELMTHCIDVVLSGEVTNDEIEALEELACALNLVQLAQRLAKYSTKQLQSEPMRKHE
jgi:hypothetical protein